ncbi:MAG: DNA-directed RNA polymerase subunit beta' [Clostridiales bacterium]|nr:DNA-directed RNA polymerase subunit beta' [Clostridiales bacterium]
MTKSGILIDSISIGIASPEKIRALSTGEVKKPETINYRSLKPERDGLFCEKIFGPSKDWECLCGKYKRIRYKGVICDRCGVEITTSRVRRERMGHIELASPVSHVWYFKGVPSRIGIILGMTSRNLEKVLYFANYIVLDPGKTDLLEKQILSEQEYRELLEKYDYDDFEVGMGAEAIKKLLKKVDLNKEIEKTELDMTKASGAKLTKFIKKLEILEAFANSENNPEWMILDVLPVIPPELRPMVQLDGGRFATSDLNDLYRRVINRNNRLKKLLDLSAPDIIIKNEKRMLQEAVDALLDNGRCGKPVTGANSRPLKSLSDLLKGKQGRFRQNLLGKRVDYSGRSVIVVGPNLRLDQCGLPKEMAIELFKPFIMKELVKNGYANNIKTAKRIVERQSPEVWDMLEDVIKDYPVLLNRAPTLHRLGIQAFKPILVEGRAIKLHPLVCVAYNADFDGDQMAVHIPLSERAQSEVKELMLATKNLLKPSDGEPVIVPSKDMVLGIYYLTFEKENLDKNIFYSDEREAILAYESNIISLHEKINIMKSKKINNKYFSGIVKTTVGRIILNEVIPQDLGFVDREIKENILDYEINCLVDKKIMYKIINRCIEKHGTEVTSKLLDNFKDLGFKYSTKSGITISISDMKVDIKKQEYINKAEQKVEIILKLYKRGMLTEDERYSKIIQIWGETSEKISNVLFANLDKENNIYMMAASGARGSRNQINQLIGMRGLMSDPSGRVIELPIKSNFHEGLTALEYFISAHGARKGLADMALRTADSGYLTRRLVDVAQDVITRKHDCCENQEDIVGMYVSAIKDGNEIIETLCDRIRGRFSAEDIIHPDTREILVKKNNLIDTHLSDLIEKLGIEKVKIRSALSCKTKVGICTKCYGIDPATNHVIETGQAVGIIAAQSIGEPGTQLTMRNFHEGGIASSDDITQGLPRVEELFEVRRPKGIAIITEISGQVEINDVKKNRKISITNNLETREYLIPFGAHIKVYSGDIVNSGQTLTEGNIYPQDLLKIKNIESVQEYILREVQKVYKLQGVDINDKHIEIIIRQMLRRVKIEDSGDSNILPGNYIDWLEYEDIKKEMTKENLKPPIANRVLLGITKASLTTESFLSAASFQETTKVLTDAAIKNKVDNLVGLKENVIIGQLIPAGTGLSIKKN